MIPASEAPHPSGYKAPGLIAAAVALFYAVAMVVVLAWWVERGLRLPIGSLNDLGSLFGMLWALLIAGSVFVSVIAIRRTREPRRGRGLAIFALILSIIPAPMAGFVIWANIAFYGVDMSDNPTYALGDCRNISTAIQLFHKDIGTWPIYTSADHSPESRVDYLYGNMGQMPEFSDEARESWGTRSEDMYFFLVTNGRNSTWYRYSRQVTGEYSSSSGSRPSAEGWAGPYLPYVTEDPWGYALLVSVSGFEGGTKPDNHVWCLSAGPNFIVETPAWATATRGDDIGYRTQ